eukprot:12598705-Heterocapsa_arctica.AAC.1
MMEEEPEKIIEADVEMPIEIKEKNMMTVLNNIADFVSQNQKADLMKIEERLVGIQNTLAASKEMTEVGLKDIDKSLDTEHFYNMEKFQEIM